MIYDIAIIGGGSAGLSAALYAARGGMKVVVFENTGYGGQVNYTYDIDNYLGIPSVNGAELAEKMRAHVMKYNCTFSNEGVKQINNPLGKIKTIVTRKNTYSTKAVIIATGATPKKLGIMGEEEFIGNGVSYCATCDGAFSKGKTATVIGGGNTAFEDAIYLSSLCSKVYIINRSNRFRAEKTLVEKAYNTHNIEIITEQRPEKIQGDAGVKSLVLAHSVSGRISLLDTNSVFIAIGRNPKSELVSDFVKLAGDASIITDEKMRTNIPGIFAAGDVRNTPLRQIITAAADGAVAATSAISYINEG